MRDFGQLRAEARPASTPRLLSQGHLVTRVTMNIQGKCNRALFEQKPTSVEVFDSNSEAILKLFRRRRRRRMGDYGRQAT